MSNERRRPDDPSDPLVSRTYRESSDERTPEHLDHVVLNEARKAAKPGYATTISWLRPAAWVTTIGLCLAIVLEVSEMAPSGQSELSTPAKIEKGYVEPEAPVVVAPAATSEPIDARRQRPAAIPVDSLDQDDRQLLRDAENRARMQTGSNQEPVDSPLQVSPAIGLASDPGLERFCEESETEDPNDWLACILELEQQGLLEAAMVERDLLSESFPDVPSLISR